MKLRTLTLALARLSTMNCCLSCSVSRRLKSLARMSVVPPGAAGVMKRTGREG